jgi:hypothetical protein
MKTLRRQSLSVVACFVLGLTGCTSSPINTRQAATAPVEVEKTVSTAHLIRVANILEKQGQTERVREVYHEILKREPNNSLAKFRLERLGNLPTSSLASQFGSASRPGLSGQDDESNQVPVVGKRLAPPAENRPAEIPRSSPFDLKSKSLAKSATQTPVPVKTPRPRIEVAPKVLKQNVKKKDKQNVKPVAVQIKPLQDRIPKPVLKSQTASSRLLTTNVAKKGTVVSKKPSPGKFLTPGAQQKKRQHLIRVIPRSATGQSVVRELQIDLPANPFSTGPAEKPNPSRPKVKSAKKPKSTSQSTEPLFPNSIAKKEKPSSASPFVLKPEKETLPVSDKKMAGHISRLMDQSADKRALAAFFLGRLKEQAHAAIPHLERALKNEESGPVKVRIAEAIARIDSSHAEAVEVITESLKSDDYQTRWEAVCAAESVGGADSPASAQVVKQLAELLNDDNSKMRTMAALKLADFGKSAKRAIPRLRLVSSGDDPQLREAANATLAVLKISVPSKEPKKITIQKDTPKTKVKPSPVKAEKELPSPFAPLDEK